MHVAGRGAVATSSARPRADGHHPAGCLRASALRPPSNPLRAARAPACRAPASGRCRGVARWLGCSLWSAHACRCTCSSRRTAACRPPRGPHPPRSTCGGQKWRQWALGGGGGRRRRQAAAQLAGGRRSCGGPATGPHVSVVRRGPILAAQERAGARGRAARALRCSYAPLRACWLPVVVADGHRVSAGRCRKPHAAECQGTVVCRRDGRPGGLYRRGRNGAVAWLPPRADMAAAASSGGGVRVRRGGRQHWRAPRSSPSCAHLRSIGLHSAGGMMALPDRVNDRFNEAKGHPRRVSRGVVVRSGEQRRHARRRRQTAAAPMAEWVYKQGSAS